MIYHSEQVPWTACTRFMTVDKPVTPKRRMLNITRVHSLYQLPHALPMRFSDNPNLSTDPLETHSPLFVPEQFHVLLGQTFTPASSPSKPQ